MKLPDFSPLGDSLSAAQEQARKEKQRYMLHFVENEKFGDGAFFCYCSTMLEVVTIMNRVDEVLSCIDTLEESPTFTTLDLLDCEVVQ